MARHHEDYHVLKRHREERLGDDVIVALLPDDNALHACIGARLFVQDHGLRILDKPTSQVEHLVYRVATRQLMHELPAAMRAKSDRDQRDGGDVASRLCNARLAPTPALGW